MQRCRKGAGGIKKNDVKPMSAANAAAGRTATSKRTGVPCDGPGVTGWQVCRFHGAGGGFPPGPAHPSWKHGIQRQGISFRYKGGRQTAGEFGGSRLSGLL
jgi:hypothetical protein